MDLVAHGGLRGSGSGTAALAVAVEQGTHRGSGTIAVGPGTSGGDGAG